MKLYLYLLASCLMAVQVKATPMPEPQGWGPPPSGWSAPPAGWSAPPAGWGAPPTGWSPPPEGSQASAGSTITGTNLTVVSDVSDDVYVDVTGSDVDVSLYTYVNPDAELDIYIGAVNATNSNGTSAYSAASPEVYGNPYSYTDNSVNATGDTVYFTSNPDSTSVVDIDFVSVGNFAQISSGVGVAPTSGSGWKKEN